MFFFLRSRKPKQFEFKPVYYDKAKEEREKNKVQKKEKRISFRDNNELKDEMYKRWDRVPYKDLYKNGRRRILITSIIAGVLIILFALAMEKLAYLIEQI